jgi:hypothetical protein
VPASHTSPSPAPQGLGISGGGEAARTLSGDANVKDALLAEIRRSKAVFYNMVVAQAQKIEVAADRVTFSFSANQRALRDTFEQNRAWLEGVALQVTGRKLVFACVQGEVGPPVLPAVKPSNQAAVMPQATAPAVAGDAGDATKKSALRERALADAGVQALLEVFPAEIRDVEEM